MSPIVDVAESMEVPKRAYVTFLAGNGDNVKGVVGLIKGLRNVGSVLPFGRGNPAGCFSRNRQILVSQGCIVREIEAVYPYPNQANFAMAYFVINYSKLRIWGDFFNCFFSNVYKPIPIVYNLVLAMLCRHPENVDLDKVKVVHYCIVPWRYTGEEENMQREDKKILVKKWWDIYEDESLDYRNCRADDQHSNLEPLISSLPDGAVLDEGRPMASSAA